MLARNMMLLVLSVALFITLTPTPTASSPLDTRYFFPSSCYDNTNRTCCPSVSGSVCGVSSGRGRCELAVTGENRICDGARELAIFWFTDWFDYACVCNGNYWGVACEACAPGWGGDDCESALPLRVRRDVDSLSKSELRQLIRGYNLVHAEPHPFWPDQTVFQWLSALHHWSFRPVRGADVSQASWMSVDFAHNGPSLAHWHRTFQYYIEYHMMNLLDDATFALPYWNWTKTGAGDPLTSVALSVTGGDGDHTSKYPYLCDVYDTTQNNDFEQCNCSLTTGPFKTWTQTVWWGRKVIMDNGQATPVERSIGCFQTWLPSQDKCDSVLKITNYSEWWGQFEGVHGLIHSFVGWTLKMGSPASDPLFFLHHGHIDLLFDQWIRNAIANDAFAANNQAPFESIHVGHSYNECVGGMVPMMTHHRMFVPSYALGYTYDYLVATDPAVTTPYTTAPTYSGSLVNDDNTSRLRLPKEEATFLTAKSVLAQRRAAAAANSGKTAATHAPRTARSKMYERRRAAAQELAARAAQL